VIAVRTGLQLRERFERLRITYSSFYTHVLAEHARHAENNRGHGPSHDATVSQLCIRIAPDEQTGEKAWLAAWCHSMDYWSGNRRDIEAFGQHVRAAVRHLPSNFDNSARKEIVQAALRHGEKNRHDQSLVQQTLQDADRLANLMANAIFRMGQGGVGLPDVEFEYLHIMNPKTSYFDVKSVLDDLRICIREYRPQFRLPEAIRLMETYITYLESFIKTIQEQHQVLGLTELKL
jgi:hypothetical protein